MKGKYIVPTKRNSQIPRFPAHIIKKALNVLVKIERGEYAKLPELLVNNIEELNGELNDAKKLIKVLEVLGFIKLGIGKVNDSYITRWSVTKKARFEIATSILDKIKAIFLFP